MEKIILYGKHAVKAAMNNPHRQCFKAFITPQNKNDFQEIAKKKDTALQIVEKAYLDKITGTSSHQGVALECQTIFRDFKQAKANTDNTSHIIILDQITDPQNIGAIIRTAHSFNASMVLMPKNNCPEESGSMAKAAAGTIDKMPIYKATNISQTIKLLKGQGYWIISLDSHAKQLSHKLDLPNKCAFIFGAEGKGIRDLVKKSCDLTVKIPMTVDSESLNVSCSAAIIMHQFYNKHLISQ